MKKILIFGMPRTGTTVLQKRLSMSLRIPNLIEPFNNPQQRHDMKDPVKWASDLEYGVVKLLAQNLDFVEFSKLVLHAKFDAIVVTQRQNFTDVVISLYYAQHIARQYHYTKPPTVNPFDVPLDYVNAVWTWHQWYYQELDWLQKQSTTYEIFDYDQYCNNHSQLIAGVEINKFKKERYDLTFVSANIDYQTCCTNYQAVMDRILQLSTKNQ
jgi:hypothetical protein